MTRIEMPLQLKDILKFERQNDISVSVYAWEPENNNEDGEDDIEFAYTLRVAKDIKPRHVNLLMISDKIKHYCSCLVSSQYSDHDGELAYCHFCIHGFCGIPIEGQCTRLQDAKRRRDEHEKECFEKSIPF